MREKCPKCGSNGKKHRYGKSPKGVQKWRCQDCMSVFYEKVRYDDEFKMQAMRVYFEGNSGRAVGRVMRISKNTIWRWMAKYAENIGENTDDDVEISELDELYTYIKKRNNKPF